MLLYVLFRFRRLEILTDSLEAQIMCHSYEIGGETPSPLRTFQGDLGRRKISTNFGYFCRWSSFTCQSRLKSKHCCSCSLITSQISSLMKMNLERHNLILPKWKLVGQGKGWVNPGTQQGPVVARRKHAFLVFRFPVHLCVNFMGVTAEI